VLKLFPKPRGAATAFVGLASPAAALALFRIARGIAGGALTACELFPRIGIDFLLRHLPGARDPLAGRHEWYVLFDIATLHAQAEADQLVEAIFTEGFDRGLVQDGMRAASVAQAEEVWRLRHSMSEVQRHEGGSIKHDVAVPVSAVPELIERASAAVAAAIPGVRPVPFGHIGDGNIHFNFSQPLGADKRAFLARWDEVNGIVHGVVLDLGGTISAEHGVGVMKRDLLKRVKSPLEIDMMRRLKTAFDPNGILNPGKVL